MYVTFFLPSKLNGLVLLIFFSVIIVGIRVYGWNYAVVLSQGIVLINRLLSAFMFSLEGGHVSYFC